MWSKHINIKINHAKKLIYKIPVTKLMYLYYIFLPIIISAHFSTNTLHIRAVRRQPRGVRIMSTNIFICIRVVSSTNSWSSCAIDGRPLVRIVFNIGTVRTGPALRHLHKSTTTILHVRHTIRFDSPQHPKLLIIKINSYVNLKWIHRATYDIFGGLAR